MQSINSVKSVQSTKAVEVRRAPVVSRRMLAGGVVALFASLAVDDARAAKPEKNISRAEQLKIDKVNRKKALQEKLAKLKAGEFVY
eukprot:gene2773-12650_t